MFQLALPDQTEEICHLTLICVSVGPARSDWRNLSPDLFPCGGPFLLSTVPQMCRRNHKSECFSSSGYCNAPKVLQVFDLSATTMKLMERLSEQRWCFHHHLWFVALLVKTNKQEQQNAQKDKAKLTTIVHEKKSKHKGYFYGTMRNMQMFRAGAFFKQ